MELIKLHDEIKIMQGLKIDTISLIHKTESINPIKKLIEAHEIIDLNLKVGELFKDHKENPIWDEAALKDLNKIRCELIVYYYTDFRPFVALQKYNKDLITFFNVMALRTNKPIC
jgi:hypothetical protein